MWVKITQLSGSLVHAKMSCDRAQAMLLLETLLKSSRNSPLCWIFQKISHLLWLQDATDYCKKQFSCSCIPCISLMNILAGLAARLIRAACLILVTARLVPFKAQSDITGKALGWHPFQSGAVTGVIFLFCASISQTDKRENNAKLLCKRF